MSPSETWRLFRQKINLKMSRRRRNSRFFIRLADLLDCLAVRLDQLDYDLPPAQIAQHPLPHRDSSRLLAMDRASGKLGDRMFAELPSLLRGNELIVLNNARVIPARLFGRRLGVFSDAPSHATRHEHLSGTVFPCTASWPRCMGGIGASRTEDENG